MIEGGSIAGIWSWMRSIKLLATVVVMEHDRISLASGSSLGFHNFQIPANAEARLPPPLPFLQHYTGKSVSVLSAGRSMSPALALRPTNLK